MITAVLFDLYETLVTESGTHPTRASRLAPALGLEADAYRKQWKQLRPTIVCGQMSFANALTQISRALLGTADEATIQRLCQQRMDEKAVAYARIDDAVAALVTALPSRGVGLAVISNGFEEDVLGWSHCSLASSIRCAAFSCREGIAKPDPEIYRRALRRLDVDPATAVYIGDGGDDELAGAASAGLRAYRAAWFVRTSPPNAAAWPELMEPADVLRLVAPG